MHLPHLDDSEGFYYQLEMRKKVGVGEGVKDSL